MRVLLIGGQEKTVHPGTGTGGEDTWSVSCFCPQSYCHYLLDQSLSLLNILPLISLDELASAASSPIPFSEQCCASLDQEDKRRLGLLSHPCQTLLIEHSSPTWQGQLWSQNPFLAQNAVSILDVAGGWGVGRHKLMVYPLPLIFNADILGL